MGWLDPSVLATRPNASGRGGRSRESCGERGDVDAMNRRGRAEEIELLVPRVSNGERTAMPGRGEQHRFSEACEGEFLAGLVFAGREQSEIERVAQPVDAGQALHDGQVG